MTEVRSQSIISSWGDSLFQQIVPSTDQPRAGLVTDTTFDNASETRDLQGETNPSLGLEWPGIVFSQWNSRTVGTNWLPFDNASLGDLLFPSPDYLDPSYDPQMHGTPRSPLHEDGEEAQNQPDNPHASDDSNLQQTHISALINSMTSSGLKKINFPGNAETANTPDQQASFYADGVGYRESRAERCIRERLAVYNNQTSLEHGYRGHQPWRDKLLMRLKAAEKDLDTQPEIPDAIFKEVISRICPPNGRTPLPEQFLADQDILLEKMTLRLLIMLYFKHFHPVNPFVDRSHLCIPIWGWSLCLATAAIGARFLGIDQITLYGDDLCAILHELLLKEVGRHIFRVSLVSLLIWYGAARFRPLSRVTSLHPGSNSGRYRPLPK